MSPEANRAVLHTLTEAFNTRRLDDFVACFSPEFALYDANAPDWPRGLAGARQMATAMLDAVPDMHATIDDIVAADDRIAVRWTYRGTAANKQSPASSDPAPVTAVAISIYRFVDGLIVEDWGVAAAWPTSNAWQAP